MADDALPVQMPDVQDPLPEANWLWRRVFTFCVTAAILWMLWGGITRLGVAALSTPTLGIAALLTLCKWMISFNILMVTYYMVAPSAEQMTKMIKTASLLRSGVQFAGRSTIETPGTKKEAASTAGLPPAPPIPGPGEAKPASEPSEATPHSDTPLWPPR
jgi:hypothetical protein